MIAFFRTFRKRLVDNRQPSTPILPGVAEDAVANAYGDNLNNPDTLVNRANKRATSGDLEGALRDFEDAIALSPAKVTTYFNRGSLFHSLGKFESAINDFSKAIELLPDYDEAFYQRGHSHRQLGDTQRAVQDYSQAIQINPYCIKAYYKRADIRAELGDPAGALNDYGQVIARVPKNANAHYRRGLFFYNCSKFAEAVDDLSAAIELNPHLADAYFQRGNCYAQLGEPEKSSQDYNQAAQYDPSHQAAHTSAQPNLSKKVPLDKPLFQPKIPSRQQASTSRPQGSGPSIKPGKLAGVIPGAATSIISTQGIDSVLTSLQKYLGRAQDRFKQGDFGGAIADCNKILNHDPEHSKAYYCRGRSFEALGEPKLALADLNQSLHWIRTQTLSRMQDFKGELSVAIKTLKQDLQDLSYKRPFVERTGKQQHMTRSSVQVLDANNPRSVASALSQAGASTRSTTTTISTPTSANSPSVSETLDRVIAEQTRLINRNPLDAEAVFNRGHSRALGGDLQGAIEDYSWTLSLDPNHKEAQVRRARCQAALDGKKVAKVDLDATVDDQRPTLSPPTPPQNTDPSAKIPATPQLSLPTLADLAPPTRNDAPSEPASRSLSDYQELLASSRLGQKTCNHAGNNPDNLFCIWCGEALRAHALYHHTAAVGAKSQLGSNKTPASRNRRQRLEEAEGLYQQGLSLFRGKNHLGSLQALSSGLKIFLEQHEMQDYQKTLNLMQDVVRSVGNASQREAIQDDHFLH